MPHESDSSRANPHNAVALTQLIRRVNNACDPSQHSPRGSGPLRHRWLSQGDHPCYRRGRRIDPCPALRRSRSRLGETLGTHFLDRWEGIRPMTRCCLHCVPDPTIAAVPSPTTPAAQL
jgi:hypothetical protein